MTFEYGRKGIKLWHDVGWNLVCGLNVGGRNVALVVRAVGLILVNVRINIVVVGLLLLY